MRRPPRLSSRSSTTCSRKRYRGGWSIGAPERGILAHFLSMPTRLGPENPVVKKAELALLLQAVRPVAEAVPVAGATALAGLRDWWNRIRADRRAWPTVALTAFCLVLGFWLRSHGY